MQFYSSMLHFYPTHSFVFSLISINGYIRFVHAEMDFFRSTAFRLIFSLSLCNCNRRKSYKSKGKTIKQNAIGFFSESFSWKKNSFHFNPKCSIRENKSEGERENERERETELGARLLTYTNLYFHYFFL